MCVRRMLMGRGRMLVGFFGVAVGGIVIALLVVLGCCFVRLGGLLVVLRSFLVCFFRHGKKPPLGVYAAEGARV